MGRRPNADVFQEPEADPYHEKGESVDLSKRLPRGIVCAEHGNNGGDEHGQQPVQNEDPSAVFEKVLHGQVYACDLIETES